MAYRTIGNPSFECPLESSTLGELPSQFLNSGFDFENCKHECSYPVPKTKKTGTTIVGVLVKNGVVLAADTRATEGPIVCDKNCEKIHFISKNIYCCGAGTAADTENSTGLISSQLELHRLNTGRTPRVITAVTMLKQMLFRYQGHVSAALVLGGVDVTGPHLYTIAPHGSTDKLPYVTMGSGSLAAMAIFEAEWKPNLSRQEGIDLVHKAIHAGIFNDLGSGGNVDICVIEKNPDELTAVEEPVKVDFLRNYDKPNPRVFSNPRGYRFEKGTAPVLKENRISLKDINILETEPLEL